MMAGEQLVTGNATLQIQRVEDQDTSVYTCFVIYMPDQESGNVDLRVEGKGSKKKKGLWAIFC